MLSDVSLFQFSLQVPCYLASRGLCWCSTSLLILHKLCTSKCWSPFWELRYCSSIEIQQVSQTKFLSKYVLLTHLVLGYVWYLKMEKMLGRQSQKILQIFFPTRRHLNIESYKIFFWVHYFLSYFPTVQQGDQVILTCIHYIFFPHPLFCCNMSI